MPQYFFSKKTLLCIACYLQSYMALAMIAWHVFQRFSIIRSKRCPVLKEVPRMLRQSYDH
jgi:hypothetical protein